MISERRDCRGGIVRPNHMKELLSFIAKMGGGGEKTNKNHEEDR